ncbi:MAG: helix-turn-helix domain-containing protein [Bacteroidetes bacterium]|nr:helix-turn-helix domain-containing protein [Bacteroidota bacterium]
MKQLEKIEHLNEFISTLENEDEIGFYLGICDFFDFRKLGKLFELNELISTYRDCIEILKSNGQDFWKTIVFIRNIIENKKYNDVQKYNFYLLLHIFFEYLLFDNIKKDAAKYIDWIEDQLNAVHPIATAYYLDFDISNLIDSICKRPLKEQINILVARKSEYLLALDNCQIPKNNFDIRCEQQINLIKEQLAIANLNPLVSESDNPQTNIDEVETSLPETARPTLTMPKLAGTDEYGDVHFAAERTGFSVSHIRLLARKGLIPRHKPTKTGAYRFYASELDEWKNNGMKNFQTGNDSSLIGKQRRKK